MIPAVRRPAGTPLRRSIRSVPTRSHAGEANEYRLRDPNVRDDSDGVRPTTEDLFDVKGCQPERVKTERRGRSYTSDERSSDGNPQRWQRFAGNKTRDKLRALSNLPPSRTPTSSRHGGRRIAPPRGNPTVLRVIQKNLSYSMRASVHLNICLVMIKFRTCSQSDSRP